MFCCSIARPVIHQKPPARRGVVLLVTLSMLILFLLIGITYLLSSNLFRRSATATSVIEQKDDPPQVTMRQALLELLRGSNNVFANTNIPNMQATDRLCNSSIAAHSILENLYGDMAFYGSVITFSDTPNTGGQFKTITINADWNKSNRLPDAKNTTGGQSVTTPGFFNGCILTITSGAAAGASARVVNYSGDSKTFAIMPLDTWVSGIVPSPGDRVMVNGRPFSGTGPGYNITSGITDMQESVTKQPWALIPNCRASLNYLHYDSNTPANSKGALNGGMNPDYTAPDFNNMFLAWRGPKADNPNQIVNIPSFHRPDLIKYWMAKEGVQNWTDLNEARLNQIMLRPNRTSHPIFCSTVNFNFDPTGGKGTWDVDNDGDGTADSVWIDVGLPTMTHKDGRVYKPLVAYLVLDMDGRLNLNAHGNLAQANLQAATNPGPYAGGSPPTPSIYGLGVGPAEININKVLNNPASEAATLFSGNGATEGRYGAGGNNQSLANNIDPLVQPPYYYQFYPYPADYYLGAGSSFASPPDINGSGLLALDYRGQPLFDHMGEKDITKPGSNPYLINLSPLVGRPSTLKGNAYPNQMTPPNDNLLTAADLEGLLRLYDIDSRSLSPRLYNPVTRAQGIIDPSKLTNAGGLKQYLLTTDSNSIPCASSLPTEDLSFEHFNQGTVKTRAYWAAHIVDLLRERLAENGMPADQINKQIQIMLPPELIAGVKMDINRPVGDGRDTPVASGIGTNVVDDPGEAGTDTFANLNGDTVIKNPKFARQIEARHLYILMMLLSNAGSGSSYPGTSPPGFSLPYPKETPVLTLVQQQELTARRIAQWAINVVHFKEPNSIITPFEYVINPFKTGWTVDGDPDPATNEGGDRRIVWGCVEPELVFMGNVSFHDRRVQDTDNDDGKHDSKNPDNGTKLADAKNPDPDMDQVRIPQGNTFLKLICTGNPNGRPGNKMPAELYNTTTGALDLERLAAIASADGVKYPVWRIAISTSTSRDNAGTASSSDVRDRLSVGKQPETTTLQPERMSALDNSAVPTNMVNIERVVWFTTQPPAAALNTTTTAYFYNRGAAGSASVLPGRYVLVAPRDHTYIGSQNDGTAGTQHIDVTATSVTVTGGANPAQANIYPPTCVLCGADRPKAWTGTGGPLNIGLNISEPLPTAANYYKQPTEKWPTAPASIAYNDAYGIAGDKSKHFLDKPLDSQAGMPLKTDNMLATGTYLNARTMFLQRLANPLEAWNKDTNPYITVDWMPMDLTVFNGENQNPDPNSTKQDPDDPSPGKTNKVQFAERMRGQKTPTNGVPTDNFWRAVSDDPGVYPTAYPDGSKNNFGCKLLHDFAYLNRTFGLPGAYPDPHKGDPAKPFPWITFNHRPFVSPYELMMVPASSQARLTTEFSLGNMATTVPAQGAYDTSANASRYPYGHLLNFFQSNSTLTPVPSILRTQTSPQNVGNFYRLFEYVTVPSPFMGTQTWLDPTTFKTFSGFMPPFNKVSNYREPGRINLNTISSSEVYEALLNQTTTTTTPNWQSFMNSRAYTPNYSGKPSDYPSDFAGVFRAPGAAEQVPVTNMRREGVDATLLRRDPATNRPLFSMQSTGDANNTDRNPYFAYQEVDRLNNLVTNRSNVFAVWITVGYFELLPHAVDQYHPDGYQLGAEIGSDTGDIKRHRAFYIIDRTIPVGFERGQDLNVHNCILLQRFIE